MSYNGARITAFPYLREAASEQFESLPDAEFAQVIGRSLGVPAEYVENWLSNIGRAFQQVAPGVAQGALSGAMGGAALGPWGMLGGAVLGGLGGALGGSRGGAAPGPAPAPALSQPPPSQPAMPGAPAAAGAPAAGALMQLLSNPALQQALMSMMLGPRTGRESVEVGPTATRVPVAAFAELIREAADQALSQYEQIGGADVAESMPEYLEQARDRGNDTGNALVRGLVLARLLEPPFGYVPATPAVAVTPVAPIAYAPAAPGAPAAPAAPTATPQPAVGTGWFEPPPTYGTPDLGIGQPIQLPTQAEAIARQLAQHRFEESLDAIFELNGSAS